MFFINIAGAIAGVGAILLFSANVAIVIARLLKNPQYAREISKRFAPLAKLFRLETPREQNGT
jgi:hypothetical protein